MWKLSLNWKMGPERTGPRARFSGQQLLSKHIVTFQVPFPLMNWCIHP